MTVYENILNNLRETVSDYFGESEAQDPSYSLELLAWSATLAVPQAVRTGEEARELAIDWQTWQQEQSLSYGDLAEFASYFREIGDRFNLSDEFAENGII